MAQQQYFWLFQDGAPYVQQCKQVPVHMKLVIERVLQFRYSQLIGDVELPGVIGDNETPQQQYSQEKIEKAVEIQYDLNITQVDTATLEPNPIEPELQRRLEPETTHNR